MPEHLRTLMVILLLATAVFAVARAPASASAFSPADFVRRRNLWFGVTIAAFLAHNFWIYIVVVGAWLLFAARAESNRLALYFLLLFAVPPYRVEIGGMGSINFLFAIDHPRLLALTVLLPTYLHLRRQGDVQRFGDNWPDRFLAGYLILQFSLVAPGGSPTNILRVAVFYPFIDIFLPYYVASRSMRNLKDFRAALMAFAIAGLLLGAVAIFEHARYWLLYAPLENSLGIRSKLVGYLGRGDSLRAVGSPGDAIALGYVIAVAMGFFLYLKKSIPNARIWMLGMGLLVAGLYSPLSRGPWLGAAVIVLVFVVTGRNKMRGIARLVFIGVLALPLLMATPVGNKVRNYLPWLGIDETNKTVDYREQLLEQSIAVIKRNPYFGSSDYLSTSELQELATGTGLIDIVNTYVGIALPRGIVGLSFFLGVFVAAIYFLFKAMQRLSDKNDEHYLLGQALLSVLAGILVIIGTVSSVSIIPVVYWSVAGLCVAYARMTGHRTATSAHSVVSDQASGPNHISRLSGR
jgi:hypothetical protein